MKSSFDSNVVMSYAKSDTQTQLEEAQALIRLQHQYITHLEKGLDVMKGMAMYITILEKQLLDNGITTVGFDAFFGMPEEKDSDDTPIS
jgi:hypothetical protein